MNKKRLPESLRRFVARQTTMPVTDLGNGDAMEQHSRYGSYPMFGVARRKSLRRKGRIFD
jgi:hypothetical protein